MIFLTKANEDKDRELVNFKQIDSLAHTVQNTTNLFMNSGKVLTVIETEEEILNKIIDFESEIISRAIAKSKTGGI